MDDEATIRALPMLVPAGFVNVAYQITDVVFSVLVYLILVGSVVFGVGSIIGYVKHRNDPKEPTITDLINEMRCLKQGMLDLFDRHKDKEPISHNNPDDENVNQ